MLGRLFKPLKNKSFFLFGARGTGKSTFLQSYFAASDILYLDLLDSRLLDEFRLDKDRFKRIVTQPEHRDKIVVVDEVQKLPEILNTVHQLIFSDKRIFVLTGSSARRLKQLETNLLAGRALVYHLYPFTSAELSDQFDLQKALEFGLLPEVYLADSSELAAEILRAYIVTYVEKEIQLEQWVRKIEPFRVFLSIAAQMNGKIVNRSAIAREVGVDDMTIASYYEILEDTLLGIHLPAYHHSVRKSQRTAPKFYLIDIGMKRALDRSLTIPLVQRTSAYGDAFEHFIVLELYKIASYARNDWKFSYYQTKEGHEIDLIVDRPGKKLLLVEIKSKNRVTAEDAKVIERLAPEIDPDAERYLLSRDSETQILGETRAVHWKTGLKELFDYR
ncbi:MAG: ATP-binding protein [Bdellovibrionales bacterium]|nr:ATP-binding protein [Bdellovibrionales bacterium]